MHVCVCVCVSLLQMVELPLRHPSALPHHRRKGTDKLMLISSYQTLHTFFLNPRFCKDSYWLLCPYTMAVSVLYMFRSSSGCDRFSHSPCVAHPSHCWLPQCSFSCVLPLFIVIDWYSAWFSGSLREEFCSTVHRVLERLWLHGESRELLSWRIFSPDVSNRATENPNSHCSTGPSLLLCGK